MLYNARRQITRTICKYFLIIFHTLLVTCFIGITSNNYYFHRKKKEYWKKIEDEFNAAKPEYFRSAEVLRTKLENILRRAKQKKGACRKYDTDTGGGPAKYEKFESADETALALLGTRAEGLPNSWCDDEIRSKLLLVFVQFERRICTHKL